MPSGLTQGSDFSAADAVLPDLGAAAGRLLSVVQFRALDGSLRNRHRLALWPADMVAPMSTTGVSIEAASPRTRTWRRSWRAGPGRIGMAVFSIALVIGVGFAGSQLVGDLAEIHPTSALPFILLGIALLVALGFEFVNGFHDTANAVATVIYTHSLTPQIAVVWSGVWNFIGVLVSTGAVAFGIISLLPVELILQVGSGAGFAMVFALLTAAIIWNLGTWYFGLPSSSSHTLIGSVIGVGLANQFMSRLQHRDQRRRLAPGRATSASRC